MIRFALQLEAGYSRHGHDCPVCGVRHSCGLPDCLDGVDTSVNPPMHFFKRQKVCSLCERKPPSLHRHCPDPKHRWRHEVYEVEGQSGGVCVLCKATGAIPERALAMTPASTTCPTCKRSRSPSRLLTCEACA